tara:strand:+ start:327 stop:1262 length:936 start_codon:yes stop_codon:yes gene_type:complete
MSYIIDNHNQTSKIVHISSRDRTLNLSSESPESYFRYNLSGLIKCRNNERMLLSLQSATIPYSFYNIRNGINDTIPYLINDNYLNTQHITIPQGNYTSTNLKDTIAQLLTTQADITSTITITFDRITMKFKFKNSSDSQNLKIDFSKREDTAFIETGFSDNEITGAITVAGLDSSNVVDVNGNIHSLFIRTNLTTTGSINSNTGGFNTVLGKVPINTNFGGVLHQLPSDATHKILFTQQHINYFIIRLTDEKDRIVNLNGLNFSLSIMIDFIYYKPEIVEPIPIRYLKKPKELKKSDKKLERHNIKQKDKY